MINLKSLGIILIINIIVNFILDTFYFKKKIIKKICRDVKLKEFVYMPLTISIELGTMIIEKIIINFILFIVCLFVFKLKLFSLNSLLMIFIFRINGYLSKEIILKSINCEFLKN